MFDLDGYTSGSHYKWHQADIDGLIAYTNKAIRDGKYLAPSHASAWQRSPH